MLSTMFALKGSIKLASILLSITFIQCSLRYSIVLRMLCCSFGGLLFLSLANFLSMFCCASREIWIIFVQRLDSWLARSRTRSSTTMWRPFRVARERWGDDAHKICITAKILTIGAPDGAAKTSKFVHRVAVVATSYGNVNRSIQSYRLNNQRERPRYRSTNFLWQGDRWGSLLLIYFGGAPKGLKDKNILSIHL